MLELIGKQYLIDLCVDTVNQARSREAYEYYVSEILRTMNNSVAKSFGGVEYTKSLKELYDYKPDDRSADEIIDHVLGKLKALED